MSQILERFGKAWSDAARDVFLIVVSILIAFALDAWWDERDQRRAEADQLATLLAEFRGSQDALAVMVRDIERASGVTIELLNLMGPGQNAPDSEQLFDLLGRSLNFGGSAPGHTALTSVLTRGNQLIEVNGSLMASLADWPRHMEDIGRDYGHLERNREIDIQAALIDSGVAGMGAMPVVETMGLPPSPFPADAGRLVQSDRAYAALAYRALRFWVLLDSVRAATEAVDEIIRQLELL